MNASSPPRAVRYLVAGRVQGVGYRAATLRRGSALEISGWVRNLPGGEVEVVATGSDDALAALAGWLWQGPPAARVERVTLEEWTEPVPSGFTIH